METFFCNLYLVPLSGSALRNTLPKIIFLSASIRSAHKPYPFSSMIPIDMSVCACVRARVCVRACVRVWMYFVIVDMNNSNVLWAPVRNGAVLNVILLLLFHVFSLRADYLIQWCTTCAGLLPYTKKLNLSSPSLTVARTLAFSWQRNTVFHTFYIKIGSWIYRSQFRGHRPCKFILSLEEINNVTLNFHKKTTQSKKKNLKKKKNRPMMTTRNNSILDFKLFKIPDKKRQNGYT